MIASIALALFLSVGAMDAVSVSGTVDPILDLKAALVLTPIDATRREQKAVAMLVDEVEKRTGLRLQIVHERRKSDATYIVVTDLARAPKVLEKGKQLEPPDKPEGYALYARWDERWVNVVGRDERGVLFGVGKLLQKLNYGPGQLHLGALERVSTAPDKPLRGHQLGYRPKTNSYDAWTPEQWEQYIRDLAVFGTNAIELIPPRSDDAPSSPHFPLPQIEMMKRMSQICDDYGLDVWIWYPALDKDYTDPAQLEFALKEWGDVFSQLPRIDAVFVPGGDPGHTPPMPMMNLLEKQTENLHKTHPNAQMWMSPQGFYKSWMDEFLNYMQTKQPKWLTGIVFGPQNRMKLPDLRAALPAQYLIRHYPDITHTVHCQFPVPDWDLAYAYTENREPVNPRPRQYTKIYEQFRADTCGFITYSEGCNDDVNKIIWSALGWDPARNSMEILLDYARYFIGGDLQYDWMAGLLGLEDNWRGPLLENRSVEKTLERFQRMEKQEPIGGAKANWRYQQGLYRAYYDAYVQARLEHEKYLERRALVTLDLPGGTSLKKVAVAEAILAQAETAPVAQDLRARVFALADDLYNSIRMQLSVAKYGAIGVERGANLDLIDYPLNNRVWIEAQFERIREMKSEKARRAALHEITHWEDAPEGGYYDDLGDPLRQPHLVRSTGYGDPEFKTEPNLGRDYNAGWRTAWDTYAETRYEAPLRAHYEGLDPKAQYTLRIVYAGDTMERKMRLDVDGVEVHGFIEKPNPPRPIEFALPASTTKDGVIDLEWNQELGGRGGGRGCQVAEMWLVKK